MSTNTITTIVLAGIVAFSLAACSKSEAPKTKVESPTPKIAERTETPKPPKQQQPTVPTLDREAVGLAEKGFLESWTQVGDSWFTCYREFDNENIFVFIQIKGVTHKVEPYALSAAETLNGLQWNGIVRFSCLVHRNYRQDIDNPRISQWSDWSNGGPGRGSSYTPLLQSSFLRRKNGQWTKDDDGQSRLIREFLNLIKPSEEQIKITLTQFDSNNGQVQGLVNSLKGARGQQSAIHQAQSSLQQMEAAWRTNTGDLQAGFNLASTYLSLQQTNSALQVFDQLIASPKADVNAVLMVAQLLVGMGRVDKLESVLERLVQISPEQAEAWYDLAALKATLNKTTEALLPLKKAIELSSQRRATNTAARDLRAEVNTDARFDRLRQLPDFISLTAPK